MSKAKEQLLGSFKSKDLGEISYVLGIRLIRDRINRTIHMDQSALINKYLETFKITTAASTPGFWKTLSQNAYDHVIPLSRAEIQSRIGALLHIGIHTRPDILQSVNKVSRQLHNITTKTTVDVDRIFQYLKGTSSKGILLDGTDISVIRAFADADWAGTKSDRKSTSGCITFLGKSPICWSSKSQQSVSLSTMESELIASTAVCQDALWLRNLLSQLIPDNNVKIILFSDNLPSLKYSSNLANDSMARHISLRYHFVRLLNDANELSLTHVKGKENPADLLTKALGPHILDQLLRIARIL